MALKFLDQLFKRINKDKPALIYLRHSKADYSQVNSLRDGILTEQGIKASEEFGESLPNTFSYRIYHSEYPRARLTARARLEGNERVEVLERIEEWLGKHGCSRDSVGHP